MGLDWNPLARPKEGAEAEFEQLLHTNLDELSEEERDELRTRFRAISDAPAETLGAPRVGYDPEADAWLVDRLRANDKLDQLDQAKSAMHGYCVLDLLPEYAGFPVYTSRGYEGVDRCTFRGKFLDDAREVIGQPLYLRAWERMSATELHEYGEALLAAGRRYATEHGLAALEHQREPSETWDEGGPESRAHIIFSAANWCLWWSSRGHGLEPWY